LDLDSIGIEAGRFRLLSIIHPSGPSIGGGHYTVDCFQWVRANNRSVVAQEPSLSSDTAYMFVYERIIRYKRLFLRCFFFLPKMRFYILILCIASVLAASQDFEPEGDENLDLERALALSLEGLRFGDMDAEIARALALEEEKSSKNRIVARAGVKNMGHSCWLSSIIQILLHSPSVVQMLGSIGWQSNEIVEGLKELSMALWEREITSSLVPQKLLGALQSSCDFAAGASQDAFEALNCVILTLIGENSGFQRIFAIETMMTRTCLGCGMPSVSGSTKQYVLRLPIPSPAPSSGSVSLIECLETFRGEQIVEGVECSSCGDRTVSSIRYDVRSAGQVLYLLVNRFDDNGHRVNTPVDLPLYLVDIGDHTYQLVGVVHNSGTTLDNGHFFVDYFDQLTQSWVHADDEKISSIDQLQTVSSTAYLIVYERI
jgi:ubiquitin C-terminal hydrolase